MGPVYALSIHADYRCRHSGVCCSSDWDVPVELPVYRRLDEALKTERLIAAAPALLKETFRQADFILNHLAVGEDLAEAWSRAEDICD